MKKSYYLLGFLPFFYSCSGIENFPNVEPSVSILATRAAGDGVYDVLGYGYDILSAAYKCKFLGGDY